MKSSDVEMPHEETRWVEEKMRHDLGILNNYVRPFPVFKSSKR